MLNKFNLITQTVILDESGWLVKPAIVKDLVTPKQIFDVVASALKVSKHVMKGYCRKEREVTARQVYCYFCKHLTTASYETIGAVMNKHYTTVLLSIITCKGLLDTQDEATTAAVKLITPLLQQLQYEKLQ